MLQITVSSGKRNNCRISLPFTICGFPWHIFDIDGQNVLEDLPTYEPQRQSTNTSGDELSSELVQNTQYQEHIDQVVDSFVESIISQVTGSSTVYSSDTDDTEYKMERLEESAAGLEIDSGESSNTREP